MIKFYLSRLICLLVGCNIRHDSSAYMPMDYEAPDYCTRCGACHDVYGIETTDHPLLYPCETPIGNVIEAVKYR